MAEPESITREILIKPKNCKNLKDIPNAWGHQKYDGQFYRIKVDKHRKVSHQLPSFGTLRDFVIRHIEGVKPIEKQKVDYCSNCSCQ